MLQTFVDKPPPGFEQTVTHMLAQIKEVPVKAVYFAEVKNGIILSQKVNGGAFQFRVFSIRQPHKGRGTNPIIQLIRKARVLQPFYVPPDKIYKRYCAYKYCGKYFETVNINKKYCETKCQVLSKCKRYRRKKTQKNSSSGSENTVTGV